MYPAEFNLSRLESGPRFACGHLSDEIMLFEVLQWNPRQTAGYRLASC